MERVRLVEYGLNMVGKEWKRDELCSNSLFLLLYVVCATTMSILQTVKCISIQSLSIVEENELESLFTSQRVMMQFALMIENAL